MARRPDLEELAAAQAAFGKAGDGVDVLRLFERAVEAGEAAQNLMEWGMSNPRGYPGDRTRLPSALTLEEAQEAVEIGHAIAAGLANLE